MRTDANWKINYSIIYCRFKVDSLKRKDASRKIRDNKISLWNEQIIAFENL
jgi:hypothetical protein